jgi:hypothetical protein
MSTVKPAKTAAAIGEGSMKGLWLLKIEDSPLKGELNSFDVVFQTTFDDGSAQIFGSVNTADTALDLRDGKVTLEIEPSNSKEDVAFQIKYKGVVYDFVDGKRSASDLNSIHGGTILKPDTHESEPEGIWSAQATPIIHAEGKRGRKAGSARKR